MARSLVFLLVLSLLTHGFVPSTAYAGGGPGLHAGGAVGIAPPIFRRPFCGAGPVHAGCIAPLRKFARGAARVGGAVLRGAARVGGAIARGVGRIGRFALFGGRHRL